MTSNREPLTTEIPLPPLPRGREVTPLYVNQLIKALEEALRLLNSTRQRTFTEISLTNTQGHGGNLRVGTVFSDGGTLKIVREGDVFAPSLVGTTALGTVTVTISPP